MDACVWSKSTPDWLYTLVFFDVFVGILRYMCHLGANCFVGCLNVAVSHALCNLLYNPDADAVESSEITSLFNIS